MMISDYVIADVRSRENGDLEFALREASLWTERKYASQQSIEKPRSLGNIIFRLDTALDWANISLDSKNLLLELKKTTQKRFPNAEVNLLYSHSHRIILSKLHDGQVRNYPDDIVEEIRNSELSDIAISADALYHHHGEHFFRLPSGGVCDFFFRVGNLQVNPIHLDAMWFWSIPFLENTSAIICDTWSVSTTAAYFATKLSRYANDTSVGWRYLSEYNTDENRILNTLRTDVGNNARSTNTVKILLSATSSGKTLEMFENLSELSESEDRDRITVLTLFKLSGIVVNSPVLCDLSQHLDDIGLRGYTEIDSIPMNKAIYAVDPTTYIPKYLVNTPFQLVPGSGDKSHTRISKSFFEKYSGYNIFTVCHMGSSNKTLDQPRHHAFHVDTAKLLSTGEFRESTRHILNSIDENITHIIHDTGESERLFCELILEVLGKAVKVITLESYSSISTNKEILSIFEKGNGKILILDSLAITGSSHMEQFQKQLRKLIDASCNSRTDTTVELIYLIGLARPNSKNTLMQWERYFPQSADGSSNWLQLLMVESCLLPDWSTQQCPWCHEKNAINRAYIGNKDKLQSKERNYIENRLNQLSKPNGLLENVFLKRYEGDEFEFNGGSYWLNANVVSDKKLALSNSDLVCAVASSIQYWRDEKDRLPMANYYLPVDTIFEPTGYNETLLRAAIWRSILPNEIVLETDADISKCRSFLESTFNSSDSAKPEGRDGEFVLGGEAAALLGSRVKRVLQDQYEILIDWEFLRNLAEEFDK